MEKENIYYATGKRKNAIAKTWMKPGKGEITINDHPVDEYFTVESAKRVIIQPLVLTNLLESYDVKVRVLGGGFSGQAGAAYRPSLHRLEPSDRRPLLFQQRIQ